jgi:alpha-tubulin suppressor-like RCC1 family protein
MEFSTKAVNGLSTVGMLGHLFINVRGSGIAVPIAQSYDADKGDGSTPAELPLNYSVQVPSGPERVIQVLAVYIDPDSSEGEFLYGEVKKDLNGGDVNVELPMRSVGSGNINAGRVAGRYLERESYGPTGITELRFKPQGASYPVVIKRGSIVNGWFSELALEEVPFELVMAGSEKTLLSNYTLNSFSYNDNKIMKINIPALTRFYSGGGGGDSQGAYSTVLGLFGPGVNNEFKVCFTGFNSVSDTDSNSNTNTYSNLYTDSSKATPIEWKPGSVGPSTGLVTAQRASSVVQCAVTDLSKAYDTVLPFRPKLLDYWGDEDAILGVSGVFRFPTDLTYGSSPVQIKPNTTTMITATFNLVPGIPTLFDTIGVYYRMDKIDSSYRSDFYDDGKPKCGEIAKGSFGFKPLSMIRLTNGKLGYSEDIPAPPVPTIDQVPMLVFCPQRGGEAFPAGYATQLDSSGDGSAPVSPGTPVTPPVVKVANNFVINPTFPGSMGTSQCQAIDLRLVNEEGEVVDHNISNSVVRSFNVTASSITYNAASVASATAPFSLYSEESQCAAPGTGTPSLTVSIASGSKMARLWVRSTNAGGGTISVSSTSFGGTISKNLQVNISSSAGTIDHLALGRKDYWLGPNQCEEVEIFAMNKSTRTIGAIGNTSIFLNLSVSDIANFPETSLSSGDASFGLYDSCSSPNKLSSVEFSANSYRKKIYIKTTSTGTISSNRMITLTPPDSSRIEPVKLFVNAHAAANFLEIVVNNGQPVVYGACVPVQLKAKDNSNTVMTSFNDSVTLTAKNYDGSAINYSFTNGCNGTSQSSIAMTNGLSPANLMMKDNGSPGATTTVVIIEAQALRLRNESSFYLSISSATALVPNRPSTLKVVATSDFLSSATNYSADSTWPMPTVPDGYYLNPISFLSAFTSTADPKADGVAMTGMPLGGMFSNPTGTAIKAIDELAVSLRFKLNGIQDSTLLSLKTATPESFTYLSAGTDYTCGITSGGNGRCWGDNSSLQLGSSNPAGSSTQLVTIPRSFDDTKTFSLIATGVSHSCGITSSTPSGELYCWGLNSHGQLGTGSAGSAGSAGSGGSSLVKVTGSDSYTSVSVGQSHTCAITTANVLKCWGDNGSGQLGDTTTAQKTSPTIIDSGTSYSKIALGDSHTCGITTNGVLKCWGKNNDGQLGDGTTVQKNSPTIIQTGTTYYQISLGPDFTCGIIGMPSQTVPSPGNIKCWGNNQQGKLGDGSGTTNKTTPTQLSSGGGTPTTFKTVSLGDNHACAIASDNKLVCWGGNSNGQRGDLTYNSGESVPRYVDSGNTYSFLTAGANHTCAISDIVITGTNMKEVKCWGSNLKGQFGNGQLADKVPLPEDIGKMSVRLMKTYSNKLVLLGPGGIASSEFDPPSTPTWKTLTLKRNIDAYNTQHTWVLKVDSETSMKSGSIPIPTTMTPIDSFSIGKGFSGAIRGVIIDATNNSTKGASSLPSTIESENSNYFSGRGL